MRNAIETFGDAADEELTAPNGLIAGSGVAVAGSIEANTQHSFVPCGSFGQDRRDVRAMMLNRIGGRARETERVRRRKILGMGVARYDQLFHGDFIHGSEIADGFAKGLEGFVVIEIADMLADQGLSVYDESDRVLQIGSGSEDRTRDWDRGNGGWCITACAAQDHGTETSGAGDGIVDAACDGTFADQERVGDSRKALDGLFVAVGDRLAGAIRAGHHQDFGRAGGEKQVVKRRVGEHYAEVVVFRRYTGERHASAYQDDGPGDGGQQRFRFGG